eukprot:CAMPEP_0114286348 /NCGR_PEP_ID=MMETSP0059-20121206/5708_1 /TAXON_ID=36894 /ORGANISM="Pyramimonas parkeae, Strain CCMP726" /LENGTH=242 /DNA_ID=CAMNT_0001407379 /DNA_START=757 /DNA_END=1485 /DNA_ORIENTATION=-
MNRQYEKNQWGQVMCHKHRDEGDAICHDCHRFLPKGCASMEDGLAMCTGCAATAVRDDVVACSMLEKVRAALKPLGLGSDGRIPCVVGSREKLQRACLKRSHMHSKLPLGLTRCKLVQHPDGRTQRFLKGVLLQSGLSSPMAYNVLAHEYGHCYMFMNRFPSLPPKLEEGVCELFTWEWMNTQPESKFISIHRDQMMKNKDPTYGEGFRAAHEVLHQHFNGNMVKLMEFLKKHGKLPSVKKS